MVDSTMLRSVDEALSEVSAYSLLHVDLILRVKVVAMGSMASAKAKKVGFTALA